MHYTDEHLTSCVNYEIDLSQCRLSKTSSGGASGFGEFELKPGFTEVTEKRFSLSMAYWYVDK